MKLCQKITGFLFMGLLVIPALPSPVGAVAVDLRESVDIPPDEIVLVINENDNKEVWRGKCEERQSEEQQSAEEGEKKKERCAAFILDLDPGNYTVKKIDGTVLGRFTAKASPDTGPGSRAERLLGQSPLARGSLKSSSAAYESSSMYFMSYEAARQLRQLRLMFGGGETEVPEIGLGTIGAATAMERSFLMTPSRVYGYNADVDLRVPVQQIWFFDIDFNYLDYDKKSNASEPIAGENVANVYIKDNPANGSPGVILGPLGLDGQGKSEVNGFGINLGFGRGSEHEETMIDSSLRFSYRRFDQMHSYTLTSPSFPDMWDFSSAIRFDTEENRYGIGPRVDFSRTFQNRVNIGATLEAYAVYRDADMDITQDNYCLACGGAGNPDEHYVAAVHDSDSCGTYDIGASIYASYGLSENMQLGVNGTWNRLGKVAHINNKTSPHQSTPYLSDSDVDAFYWGAYWSIDF